MTVTSSENSELASYGLREVAQVWYVPSLDANPRDEMSRIMVYAQSIEESKHRRITKNLKSGIVEEQNQPRIKKRAPIQAASSAPNINIESGSGSQVVKPTCARCGKKHFGKGLAGTGGWFGCVKDGHKVMDCPTIAAIGKEAKEVPPSARDDGAAKINHFYFVQAKTKSGEDSDKL
ncbi:uncharacterized protein LOC107016669 [Solanum pennellii]|uniref:Uncharacterized protein LOC107016669 n=1 Tax=Solanum pennellii TaxID=28526 RepID=A0ABM1GKX6_SOLPN|nr:uncharacterized protein LOC107016669 [Solanum pennellii]